MPACGLWRTPASVLVAALARGPRAVPCRGLAVAALAFSEGALRCSLREGGCDAAVGTAGRGAHLTASRRPGGYAGLPLAALRCSPAPMRPVRALPSRPGTRGVFRALEYTLPVPARLRAGGPGSEWAAPSSAGLRGLPAAQRRAGEDCSSTGSGSPQAARRGRVPQPPSQTEQRREAGPQGRPPTAERTGPPARSLARPNATIVNAPQATNGRSRANVRSGFVRGPPFVPASHASRVASVRRSN